VRNSRETTIEGVTPESPSALAGIAKGDVLLSINGHRVSDVIDYMFYKNEPELKISLSRRGKRFSVKLSMEETEDPGLELRHFKVRTCKNKCIFCFVSQLPRGLRKTLYVRDEDYRMSFLYGNYVTLTGLTAEDKKRIARQRLSPLYISVHATDRAVRNTMLGNPKAPDIMKDLRFLKDNKIRMHTQIVLCPGVNDGAALKKTVRDLYSLHPYVVSIAVVPVGITEHGRKKPAPVTKEDAEEALGIIEALQKRFRKKHGEAILYASDELYIRAERPFPALKDFGELPQIENGVGTVPAFVSRARRMKVDIKKPSRRRFLAFTGVSFYPYLKSFTDRLEKQGIKITLVPVVNTFFGASVTVTGLLTGRDVIKSMSAIAGKHDVLLIPDVALKDEWVFLDDVTVSNVETALGIRARVVEATPDGLLKGFTEDAN
jgi:putative radical SAM enzyme (TIGR03279 family)